MKPAKAGLGRRLDRLEEAAGVNACATCVGWADVIMLERPGEKRAPFSAWGPWAKHKGRCPACGREPVVTVVKP